MKSDKTKQKGWRIPEPLVTRLETVAKDTGIAEKVARWLGNSARILLRHYTELVGAEEATKFWSIRP